jgi:hypothetical protein
MPDHAVALGRASGHHGKNKEAGDPRMKAFLLSVAAMVLIAGTAAIGLDALGWSSSAIYSTDNVRLD